MARRGGGGGPFVGLGHLSALAVVFCSVVVLAQPPTLADLPEGLVRASRWTVAFVETFASVLVEERYDQVERTPGETSNKRSTRAEMILLRRAQTPGWVHFRDVFEVNGRPVSDRRERLQRLFLDSPETALRDARRLTEESSRYNLETVVRTINVPTFGLLPLDAEYIGRFEFRANGDERIDGGLAARVDFVERKRRSLVRTLTGADVPITGSVWIESATGRVLRTVVKTRGTQDPDHRPPPFDGHTLMWVETTYGPVTPSGAWAPVQMREWSRSSGLREVFGTASYSNLRRFAVDTATSFTVNDR